MFSYKTQIRLHHTDAAGILFYGRIYDVMNEAYEALFSSFGLDVNDVIFKLDFLLPFVHTEADYNAPLTVGDQVEIQIEAERIGSTSVTLVYHIIKDNGVEAATCRTVSVSVDKKTFKKIPLPDKLRTGLESI